MKSVAMAALAVLLSTGGAAVAAQDTTEVAADKQAAAETVRCSRDYLRRGTSGMSNTQTWIMCVQASAELARRNTVSVAKQVAKQEGYNVFEIEEDPGWFSRSEETSQFSPQMLEMLERGE